MGEYKDMHGNILDDWPTCLFCGDPLGYWEGDRYFCQRLGCPLHYIPAEWTAEIEKDGTYAVVMTRKLDAALSNGWRFVRGGVGYAMGDGAE